jgi:hypothetical protein
VQIHLNQVRRKIKNQGYPQASGFNETIHPVDFMLLSSLRTQENGALDYEPNRDHFVAANRGD